MLTAADPIAIPRDVTFIGSPKFRSDHDARVLRETRSRQGLGGRRAPEIATKRSARVTEGNRVVVSFGAIEKMVAWTDGKKLFVDTTIRPALRTKWRPRRSRPSSVPRRPRFARSRHQRPKSAPKLGRLLTTPSRKPGARLQRTSLIVWVAIWSGAPVFIVVVDEQLLTVGPGDHFLNPRTTRRRDFLP